MGASAVADQGPECPAPPPPARLPTPEVRKQWPMRRLVQDVGCGQFIASAVRSGVDPRLLPVLTFALAAAISFCTGTSWGTMSLLFPLALPAAWAAAQDRALFLLVTSAVLAGSVFGDHATAISDTTVLSAMACRCDVQRHVVTQLPYAATVGGIALVFGYLLSSYAYPAWVGLIVCLVATALVGVLLGADVSGDRPSPIARWVSRCRGCGRKQTVQPLTTLSDAADAAEAADAAAAAEDSAAAAADTSAAGGGGAACARADVPSSMPP